MKKTPYWFPYPSSFIFHKKQFHIEYKGGQLFIDPNMIHSILLYGSCCPLNQDVLDECIKRRIPLIYHRRNLPVSVWITSSFLTDTKNDILEKQILYRQNVKKRAYVTRRLLDAKFKSMQWLVGYPQKFSKRWLDIAEMQNIEAHHARGYWQEYFRSLAPGAFRRSDNKYAHVLDAVSKFIEGVLLRWITFHRLSPYHGFLHRPESYTALVYDLMEPYRGYVEKHIFENVFVKNPDIEESELTAFALNEVKSLMRSEVFVPVTRQVAAFQELYHGSVLALRAYLLGFTKRMVVPIPGLSRGGRPISAGYRLYGRGAGSADIRVRS